MEETLIVVMLKDVDGFLDKELGSYKVEDEHGYIYNTYAIEEDGKYMIYLKLTCDRDVDDWEFEAIYDYYDVQSLPDFVRSVKKWKTVIIQLGWLVLSLQKTSPRWKIDFKVF